MKWIRREIFTDQALFTRKKTVKSHSKQIRQRWTFSLKEALLWIMDYGILARSDGLQLKRLNDGFVLYKYAVFHFTRC